VEIAGSIPNPFFRLRERRREETPSERIGLGITPRKGNVRILPGPCLKAYNLENENGDVDIFVG
jgi:hypothetical protein